MHNLLLFDVNDRQIPLDALDRIFHLVDGFQQVRRNTPTGTPIEANFVHGNESTTVRLDSRRETISITGTSDTALRAALILQAYLQDPLRIVDTEYSFDLVLADYSSIEELARAIDRARAS